MTLVVAAALLHEGRLLAARRTAPSSLAGRWELPGGKVEPGEDPVAALHREVHEELGIQIEVLGEVIPEDDGSSWPLPNEARMRVWLARPAAVSPEPQPHADHDLLRWLKRSQLDEIDWLETDLGPVAAVRRFMDP